MAHVYSYNGEEITQDVLWTPYIAIASAIAPWAAAAMAPSEALGR